MEFLTDMWTIINNARAQGKEKSKQLKVNEWYELKNSVREN